MPYRHLLVICDGSSEADDAVRAASELARRDRAKLTVAEDAIMPPAPSRRRLGRLLPRDRASALRRRANCPVLQPL